VAGCTGTTTNRHLLLWCISPCVAAKHVPYVAGSDQLVTDQLAACIDLGAAVQLCVLICGQFSSVSNPDLRSVGSLHRLRHCCSTMDCCVLAAHTTQVVLWVPSCSAVLQYHWPPKSLGRWPAQLQEALVIAVFALQSVHHFFFRLGSTTTSSTSTSSTTKQYRLKPELNESVLGMSPDQVQLGGSCCNYGAKLQVLPRG